MKTVFVVDDSDTARVVAKNALDSSYRAFALPSASKMLKLAEKIMPDLIVMDLDMPGIDGFEAMSLLKSDVKLNCVPVIFLTGKYTPELEIRCFEMGAKDFICKPVSSQILIKRIETHIETSTLLEKNIKTAMEARNTIIGILADTIESRDRMSVKRIERTQAYLKLLVNELVRTETYQAEISDWDIDIVLPSAQLYDIGKIYIDNHVLNSPDKLADEEFELLKQHCSDGERIIGRLVDSSPGDVFFCHAMKFAGYHHERWDGTGYPRGLSCMGIPLEGRLMALVDVYDALVSERPYRNFFSHKQALEIIKKGSGTHFDPNIVNAFLSLADDFCSYSTGSHEKR